jgi:apolipoprotein N-acyltransferase
MQISRKKKALLGIAAGAGMALAMPGFPFGPLVFIALIPLLVAFEEGSGFLPAYLAGLTFFLINLRWLFTLARFDLLAIPGMLLLCVYLGLYFGLFGMIVGLIRRRWSTDRSLLIIVPVLFALFEILRNVGPLALGFSSLYQSLYRFFPLIQLAAYLGPWSITAVIAFVNVALYLAIRRRRLGYGILAVGAVAALFLVSLLPVADDGESLKVAIVSSQVSQEEKLDDRNLFSLLDHYSTLGQDAAARDPDLIIFPESILPGYILRDDRLLPTFTTLAKQEYVEILLGTGDYNYGKTYNSIAAITPRGDVVGTYDMVHPVPFGEVIPGRSVLERIGLKPFIDSLLPQEVTPGGSYSPLMGVGTPICFESTFPTASREFVRNGASLLAVVTNDAWFLGSSELPAHFACAVFRAVETRRYLLQAANEGISGVIDMRGRIIASQEEEGIVTVSVTRSTSESFYTRYGDLPLYTLFVVVVLIAGVMEVRKKNKGRD